MCFFNEISLWRFSRNFFEIGDRNFDRNPQFQRNFLVLNDNDQEKNDENQSN